MVCLVSTFIMMLDLVQKDFLQLIFLNAKDGHLLRRFYSGQGSEVSPITYDGVDPDTIYQKIVPKITQEIDLRRICLSVRTRGQISDLSYENLRGQTLNERVHHLIEICTVKSKLDVLIEVCIAQDIIKKGTI
jgi:hypothetical protein